jgi:hypothetical protein
MALPRPAATPSRRAGHILLVVLLLLTPLLALEVGVRLLVATHRLPVAPAHTREFEVTWTNLSRGAAPDVLILGDSVSQQGIEPTVLGRRAGRALGETVSVFNAASPGGTVSVNRVLVEQLAREGRLPRVAIVGIYPGTLKNDLTYTEFFGRSPMGGIFGDCELEATLEGTLACRLNGLSLAWRWRGQLDRIATSLVDPVPLRMHSGGLRLRQDGFREGRGVPLSRLDAQLAQANLDRRLFAFPPEVLAGYARLVDELRENDVAIVAVQIPDTPVLEAGMEAYQPGRLQMMADAVAQIEAATGLDFIEIEAFGSWWADGMARNFNHLSAEGAKAFTAQLWEVDAFREQLLAALR